jgi:hypothetical protein
MPRGVHNSTFLISAFVIFLGGCGGGGGRGTQPPPPQPDFTIGFSATTVSVTQGSSRNRVGWFTDASEFACERRQRRGESDGLFFE